MSNNLFLLVTLCSWRSCFFGTRIGGLFFCYCCSFRISRAPWNCLPARCYCCFMPFFFLFLNYQSLPFAAFDCNFTRCTVRYREVENIGSSISLFHFQSLSLWCMNVNFRFSIAVTRIVTLPSLTIHCQHGTGIGSVGRWVGVQNGACKQTKTSRKSVCVSVRQDKNRK